MIKHALITNKFYLYSNIIVKLKKISKKTNKITVQRLDNGELLDIPYVGNEIILYRIYTVGEVSKIVEKRPDTLRKYEKKMLTPEAKKFGSEYQGYENWRYYTEQDVYQMVEFFNSRIPGRPVVKSKKYTIQNLSKKIETKTKE